tara:strand:- start:629 stop:1579 length:951 start_codon:yes stop_codon:yes gene_type:complete
MLNEIFIRDTVHHPQPSGMLFYRGFKKRGDNVMYLPLEQKINLNQIDYNYDSNKTTILIDYTNILNNPNHIKELEYFKLKNNNSKIFLSAYLPFKTDGPEKIDERFYAYKGLVDGVFNTVISFPYAEELFTKIGLKYMAIPFAMDPYYDEKYFVKYQVHDVGFIGSTIEGNRFLDIWYEPLKDRKDIFKYFSGFNEYPGVKFEDTNMLFQQTKINLNPHYAHQFGIPNDTYKFGPVFDFNARTFSLAGLGCFQLNNHPYMKKYFGDDIPVFDKNNFMELFEYYLKNEDERIKVTNKIQEITLKEHTMENRIKQLLS